MLQFDEQKHEYTLDGKKLISVTQLMQKHGLAPNYAGVSTEVLNKKAERGTLIHEEIEAFNKRGEIGFTPEMDQFKKYVETNNIMVAESESRVNNDIVAGTIDLVLRQNEQDIIADIKTTYTLHINSVSWQLSIYLYLYLTGLDIEEFNPKLTYELYQGQAFHFNKESELNVVNIPLQPYEEVEKLMECERNGVLYKNEVEILNVDILEVKRLEELIKYCDEQKKKAEEQSKALKEILLNEMEARGLKTFEKEGIKITYVASSTRSTIDSAKLKKELPDIAEKYSKDTQVKATLKITIKENKNDN